MLLKTTFTKIFLIKIFISDYFTLFIMKCDICNNKIEETFLEKIKGIYIKVNSKLKYVCDSCQRKYSMEEIRNKLG